MEQNIPNHQRNFSSTKIGVGLIFIFLGGILFLFNFGFIPDEYYSILFSWQSLLMAIGFIMLFSRNSKLSGSILMLIGAFFLLPYFYDYNFPIYKLVFPIIIIFIGFMMIFKVNKRRFLHKKNYQGVLGYLNETYIFSGNQIFYNEPIFKGGTITTIFGGCELDLTQTKLPEGTTVLEITAIFGGVEILVPSNWKVTNKVTGIFGAIEDKRRNKLVDDNLRELIITGTAIFGGGDLKS